MAERTPLPIGAIIAGVKKDPPVQLRRAVRESRVMGIGGAPATGVGRELKDEIGKRLQASYGDMLDEPLPPSLRALVEKLQAAAPKPNKAPPRLVGKERLRKAR
jgi:hypothetical protein